MASVSASMFLPPGEVSKHSGVTPKSGDKKKRTTKAGGGKKTSGSKSGSVEAAVADPPKSEASPSPTPQHPPRKKQRRETATPPTPNAAQQQPLPQQQQLEQPPPPPPGSSYAAMAYASARQPQLQQQSVPAPPPQQQQLVCHHRQQQPPQQQPQAQACTPQPQSPRAAAGFRSLDLPIASFSAPDPKVTDEDDEDEETEEEEEPQHAPVSSDAEESTAPAPPMPLPTTPGGQRWIGAIRASRAHERYGASFNFDRYKELDDGAIPWVESLPHGEWAANNPVAIAVDCEMCETKDPVTGKVDSKALCRLSVVDASDPSHPEGGEVLLDTLVKPDWPITDCRTRIHGISRENLENVQFTLRHAQAFMAALCSDQTVLVGHAVHNDLAAIRMEHHCNADSSFVFPRKGQKGKKGAQPGLKDLCYALTGAMMPQTHCSVNDARVALMCVNAYITAGGKVEPVGRAPRKAGGERRKRPSLSQLLVHHVPHFVKPSQVSEIFLAQTTIRPTKVSDLERPSEDAFLGKMWVSFASADHADLAFDTLDAEEELLSGFQQKTIQLGKKKKIIKVRKCKSRFRLRKGKNKRD